MLEDIYDYEGLENSEGVINKEIESVGDSSAENTGIEVAKNLEENLTEVMEGNKAKISRVSFEGKGDKPGLNELSRREEAAREAKYAIEAAKKGDIAEAKRHAHYAESAKSYEKMHAGHRKKHGKE